MDFKLHYHGHKVIENDPFLIDRPEGSYRYIFFHFISTATVEINGVTHEVSPGSCILYQPGTKQKFFVTKSRLNHDYLDFEINDLDFFETIRFPLDQIFNPRSSELITETISKIHAENNSNRVGNYYIISSIMTNLFVLLSRRVHNHSVGVNHVYADKLKHQFEQLRLSMYHNPADYSVTSMAKSLGFSSPYFSSLFKEFFNISPIDDLTNARISLVKELLKSNEETIVIVKKLGFSSVEYYYRWFKRSFKLTQSEYKDQIK